jgi:predicted TIM-barrel fold metal-dependent hydrolase
MVEDGVSAEVLYPSLAMTLYAEQDVAFQEACFRVYNDWLGEYCSVAPASLVGVPAICTYDIDHALAELERAHALGLQGAALWLAPDPRIPFHSSHYDELWRVAARDRIPIGLHILTGFDHMVKFRAIVNDADVLSESPFPVHLELARDSSNSKILGCANTLFDLIFSGVFDRFPALRVVLVEGDVGWIPFFAHRWDYYYERDRRGDGRLGIERMPSEYLRRNIFCTFVDDPSGAELIGSYGTGNWMWASDFPHSASSWPNSQKMIEDYLGHLSDEERHQVLFGTAAELYRFA